MSELLAIGASHKTAPVEVRERLALPDARRAGFVRDLRGAGEVHEAVTISTCNRTELYLVVGNPVEAESRALAMLASQAGIRPTELAGSIYSLRNCDAARHLYLTRPGTYPSSTVVLPPTRDAYGGFESPSTIAAGIGPGAKCE